jgi:hypothetical protein
MKTLAMVVLLVGGAVAVAVAEAPMVASPTGGHVMVDAAKLAWGPAPPALPAGSKLAVLKGDLSREEAFVIRAWVPAGYKVGPHWHPTTENLTILSGTVGLGMGDTFDKTKLVMLGAGGFASMPGVTNHFFWAETEATFQVHGTGPFQLTYLNPADDPRKAAPAK